MFDAMFEFEFFTHVKTLQDVQKKSLFSCPKMTECKFETGMFFLSQVPQHAYPVNPRQGGSQRRFFCPEHEECACFFPSFQCGQVKSLLPNKCPLFSTC